MAYYNPPTSVFGAGTAFPLDPGDVLNVNAGILVGSTISTVIFATGATTWITIAGRILGAGTNGAIYLESGIMDIAATGTVTGNESLGNGAVLINTGASVSNDGSITSSGGYGIIVNGLGSSVINAGHITGGTGGVFMGLFDSSSQDLTNTGQIMAGTRGGAGVRYGHGVQIEGDSITVYNAGSILAASLGKAGIHLGGYAPLAAASGVDVTNTGTIHSGRGWGVDGIDNLAAGFTLHNSGTISGSLGAVRGTGGADVIVNTGVLAGNVALGAGLDTYRGAGAAAAVSVDGGAGFDLLVGGMFDDSLYGGSDGDTLRGGAGDDSLQGGAGADALYGGVGDDTMAGGAGNDIYRIASLADLVTEAGGVANGTTDRIVSSTISVDLTLYANVEAATLTGIVALNLTGSGVANSLTGNVAANRITGGAGADTMTGGDGADVITGGTGRDSLTGGTGADVFVLLSAAETGLGTTTRDAITDFAVGVDDLRMIFMNSFIGAAGFTAVGQVRYVAATGLLSGSTDADAAAEWTLQMATGLALTSGDFVF